MLPTNQALEKLTQELGVSRGALSEFIKILSYNNVPIGEQKQQLQEIVTNYKSLLSSLEGIPDAEIHNAVIEGNSGKAHALLQNKEKEQLRELARIEVRRGDIAAQQKDFDAAEKLYQEALTLQERELGANDPDTIETRRKLQESKKDRGEP